MEKKEKDKIATKFIKQISDVSEIKSDLEEIKNILNEMSKNLKILSDILDTRKRVFPSSEELFGK